MNDFVLLLNKLEQTTKTLVKVDALAQYFSEASEEDKIWALAFLSERRPKRTVNTTFLRLWASEKAQVALWLFEECYHTVGDLAETIALLIAKDEVIHTESLSYWMQQIIALGDKTDVQKKEFISEAWNGFDYYTCFVFNKIITGGLRIGVSERLVIKALSRVLKLNENVVAHRISGNWKPAYISFEYLFEEASLIEDDSKPYPFYLAYPLEEDIETLGTPSEWQAEWKWDGLRGQVIKRNDQFFVWSRGEELITDKFPELQIIKDRLPDGTVLDGEIICWRGDKPLPFNILQTRIGRKTVSTKHLKDAPVILLCYDILEWEGKDIRPLPMKERRYILEQLVQTVGSQLLQISPVLNFDHWQELALLRAQSRENLIEGVMLKKLDSVYETGRRRGKWWKWKISPYTIDGVLIYAQKGHGRRADLFTDYTFAVWEKGVLVPFAKAYSGLTDKEMAEVDNYVKRNTLEKFGPVRSVTPDLVFELAFEGINHSPRHKSGIALRFPRILRWRKDKKAAEADTLDNLKALANL